MLTCRSVIMQWHNYFTECIYNSDLIYCISVTEWQSEKIGINRNNCHIAYMKQVLTFMHNILLLGKTRTRFL